MLTTTEKNILDTARTHFIQKGFAGARMQEIADEAGSNKALLHYYFRSKENLYREVVRQTLNQIFPRLVEALSTEGSFWEKVDHLVTTYIDTMIQHPHIPLFIMSELSRKKESFIEELRNQTSDFAVILEFVDSMKSEMQKGVIRTMSPVHLLLNIMSMTIFPFMARPVFSTMFQMDDTDFEALMMERKLSIVEFLRNALYVQPQRN